MLNALRRPAALTVVVLMLFAACGGSDDPDADRVISSPSAAASSEPTGTGGATTAPGASATTGSTTMPANPTVAPTHTVTPAELAKAKVKLTKIGFFTEPVVLAQRGDDTALYIAEKGGRIKKMSGRKVVGTILDISSQVKNEGEQGLLGLAFHPNGTKLYVYFTTKDPKQLIREYDFDGSKATSPRDVLSMDDPYPNHNGGNLIFGSDGYLYVSTGDGGAGGDPQNRAQNLEELLGKMLRIDPAHPSGGKGYSIPDSNPFVGKAGRDEIWAFGLRNPWRYSFDRRTHDLWIGDVGQYAWEEIDFTKASSKGGENYGWHRMEATHGYEGGTPPPGHHAPIFEYSHDDGSCSVTGGYVYRGAKIRDLQGAYVFGDFCTGKIRAFVQKNGKATGVRMLGIGAANLASFGQDHAGELYVLSLGGDLLRIDPA